MATEYKDEDLAGVFRKARALPRAGAKQKAMSAMAEAAAALASQHRTIVPRRKVLLAGAFVIALVATGFLVFPRRHAIALADVARAMANVHSAHFVGWDPSQATGGRDRLEGWLEPRRARFIEGDVIDEFIDESRHVQIRSENGSVHAIINPLPAQWAKLLQDDMGYLAAFLWPQAAQDVLLQGGETVAKWQRQYLPGGRSVVVVDLTAGDQMTRMTVDEATDLVLRIEYYRGDALVGAIEQIEYNVDIPEEVFRAPIPEGAIVVDTTAQRQASPEQLARYADWLAKAKQLQGAVVVSQVDPGSHGDCGTPFHHDLGFETLDNGGMILVYLPQRNSYRVFGRAMMHQGWPGPGRVVENTEVVAPTRPDITVEQWQAEEARSRVEEERHMPTPEMRARWDAKAEELVAIGARHLVMCDMSWPAGNRNGGCAFEGLNDRYVDIWYMPARGEYYVMGKARIYNDRGFDQTVEDGWIKVPGPPPELPDNEVPSGRR